MARSRRSPIGVASSASEIYEGARLAANAARHSQLVENMDGDQHRHDNGIRLLLVREW